MPALFLISNVRLGKVNSITYPIAAPTAYVDAFNLPYVPAGLLLLLPYALECHLVLLCIWLGI